MKNILDLLLSFFKRDIKLLWQQPLFLSLFIVVLLVAGLSYWILALVLWAIFASAIYLGKHYWSEDKGATKHKAHSRTVDAEVVKTTTKAAPKKKSAATKSTAAKKKPAAKKTTPTKTAK